VRATWITFYSARGGVGRSTLLGLCALELARRGRRVIVIDFNLDAPGLDLLLTPADAPAAELARPGVVDYLVARSKGEPLRLEDMVVPRELPGDYKGRLFVLSAGRCDEHYLDQLGLLDFPRFHESRGLSHPARALRADVDEQLAADVVLVDARTGYADPALFTLVELADAAVTVLVPDLQNTERLAPVVQRFMRSPRKPRPGLFLVANKCHPSPAALRAVADVEDTLRALVPVGEEALPAGEETPFLYKVAFDSSYLAMQRLLPPPVLSKDQRALSDGLSRFIDRSIEVESGRGAPASSRKTAPRSGKESAREINEHGQMLDRLGGAWHDLKEADHAEKDPGLLRAFFFASQVAPALRPDRPLVRGRTGSGKSAVFRLLTEQPAAAARHCPELRDLTIVAGHGSPRGGDGGPRYLSVEDFRAVDELVQAGGARWNELFRLYAVAQMARAIPALATNARRRDAAGLLAPEAGDRPERLRRLLDGSPQRWRGELLSMAAETRPGLVLVYDHLHAAFGSGTRAGEIRRAAVTGLLDAWGEDAEELGDWIRPKILLREDVFAALAAATVSRWRAHDVELRWDFAELVGCLSKRTRLDPELESYLERHGKSLAGTLDELVAEFVVLFDQRVRPREKQDRTWLTVHNRLADAGGQRSPRDFLRFAVEALKLEVEAPREKRMFAPALIAGTHARAALPKVSERRVVDLREELPDDAPMIDRMRGLMSPFDADELVKRFAAAVPGAQSALEQEHEARAVIARLKEHGAIGDFAASGSTVRLFVPDLYLWGLGMNRHGW
jgi:hypothetical protein